MAIFLISNSYNITRTVSSCFEYCELKKKNSTNTIYVNSGIRYTNKITNNINIIYLILNRHNSVSNSLNHA